MARASSARRGKTSAGKASGGVAARKKTARTKASGTRSAGSGRASKARLRVVAADHLKQPRQAAVRHLSRLLREVVAIAALFAALILFLALISFHSEDPGWSHTGGGVIHNHMGRAGAWFADVSLYLFGFMAYLIPGLLLLWGVALFRSREAARVGYRPLALVRLIGALLMLIAASGLADLHVGVPEGRLPQGTFGGGVLGTAIAWWLVAYLHPLGTTLLLMAVFFCSLTLAFGTSWIQLIENLGALVLRLGETLINGWHRSGQRVRDARQRRQADHRRMRRTATADPGLPAHAGHRLLGAVVRAPMSMLSWRRTHAAEEADPLLDAVSEPHPRGGLAAALDMARQRERSRSVTEDALPASQSPDRFDTAAEALVRTEPLGRGAAGQAAAALESTSSAGNKTGCSTESPAVPDAAFGTFEAEPASTQLPRRRKPSIKPRAAEQQQAKLFLDVPDSDLPPLSLLDVPAPQRPGFTNEELEALSRLLEDKLAEFRIVVEVVAVHPGPVITRFEMQPAPGIKASRITNLSQDIARSMSLPSVRVVEVIPGKSTVGIEVPNDHREIVQLSEMLRSDAYVDKKSPLTLALGKDISGQPVTADLARMPHLLVAGTTGSGKSVAVNAMLISLLYKSTAKDVRLILIDPKMLELNVYDDIPHLLSPVVTDMKEAANALRWCVGEMERRYTLMAELKVRNLAGYNRKISEAEAAGTPIVDPLYDAQKSLEPTAAPPELEPMPTIVVVVDEFADMMMQVGKKAEEMIARIAQKARAAGIHLILATQRPSVDVITGLIKANVPTRIAFQVSQKVDSRTILDQGGAESLLGHGDMLYLPPGTAVPVRVHGAFVDDHEVHNVVSHIKQSGSPNYIEEILHESTAPIPGLSGGSEESDGEHDALYDQAVAVVCESRKASISYVQRRLKIGYNRAARMIEEMEASGVVSTVTANGTREVLAPPPV